MAPQGVWADEPFTLLETPGRDGGLDDPVVYVASHMALVHNTLIRALNTIYLQCSFVSISDHTLVTEFLSYCQSWGTLVELHHSTEERILFPRLAKLTGEKDSLQVNIEQHEAFHDGLSQFNAYVVDTRPADFEAGKLKALIDSFAAPLMEHFKAEIGSLMALKKYGAAVMKVHQEFEVEVRKRIDSARVGPMTLLNTDKTFEGGKHPYPEMPFFVPFLIKHLVSRKHTGSWKFGCCDYYGQPRTLWYHGARVPED